MRNVQFIEGAGYCEPSKKGDLFGNKITIKDWIIPMQPQKKRHKRKKELNDFQKHKLLNNLSYETNTSTQKI